MYKDIIEVSRISILSYTFKATLKIMLTFCKNWVKNDFYLLPTTVSPCAITPVSTLFRLYKTLELLPSGTTGRRNLPNEKKVS